MSEALFTALDGPTGYLAVALGIILLVAFHLWSRGQRFEAIIVGTTTLGAAAAWIMA